MKGKITVFIKLEFVNSILLRPCEFCGCLFLKSENCRSRKYCCNQNRLNDNSVMPDIGLWLTILNTSLEILLVTIQFYRLELLELKIILQIILDGKEYMEVSVWCIKLIILPLPVSI